MAGFIWYELMTTDTKAAEAFYASVVGWTPKAFEGGQDYTVLNAGDCAGFKAGVPNGHKIENRSGAVAVLLEVGTRTPGGDGCDYPDIDMVLPKGADRYFHRDGTPYPKYPRRS